jgi:hypothetical protein
MFMEHFFFLIAEEAKGRGLEIMIRRAKRGRRGKGRKQKGRKEERVEGSEEEREKKRIKGLGVVVFACNPSYLGGRDRKFVAQGQPRQS